MVFQHNEDLQTLRNIGINVALLMGVTLLLIAGSILFT